MSVCGHVTWYEHPISEREAIERTRRNMEPSVRARPGKPYFLVLVSTCALPPGHDGVHRCEEQLLQMIDAAAE